MYNISEIAATLGVSGKDLNKFLLVRNVVRRKLRAGRYRMEPAAEYEKFGDFKNVPTESGAVPHWQWNDAGRDFIIGLWGGDDVVATAESFPSSADAATSSGYSVYRTFDAEGRLHSRDDRPARVKRDASGTVRCEEWFEHGRRDREGVYGNYNGAIKMYDASGRLTEVSHYCNDKLLSLDGSPCTLRLDEGRIEYGYADGKGNLISRIVLDAVDGSVVVVDPAPSEVDGVFERSAKNRHFPKKCLFCR